MKIKVKNKLYYNINSKRCLYYYLLFINNKYYNLEKKYVNIIFI